MRETNCPSAGLWLTRPIVVPWCLSHDPACTDAEGDQLCLRDAALGMKIIFEMTESWRCGSEVDPKALGLTSSIANNHTQMKKNPT